MLLACLLILFPQAFAQQAVVWARDPASIRGQFSSPQYKILDRESEMKELKASGYVMPRERDALFHRLGLEKAVRNYDELRKDMLVMGARFETLKSLRKHFPQLSRKQLESLVSAVKALQ